MFLKRQRRGGKFGQVFGFGKWKRSTGGTKVVVFGP